MPTQGNPPSSRDGSRRVRVAARVRALRRTLALVLAAAGVARSERVFVFAPCLDRPGAVQAALQSRWQGGEVVVFGRLADFSAMVEESPPDVIVAPRPLVERFAAFRTFLRGTRKGATSEEAVLVSRRPIEAENIPGLSVGVVGILERAQLAGLVRQALGAQPRIKVVTKLEDLLPLLTFGSADALLVGEGQAEEIRARSQAQLLTVPAPGRLPLVVAAARGDAARAEASLKALGAAERRMLGVDGWTR